MNTNEIISYDLALSPNLKQIKRMLDKAFDKFSSVNGLIFHSDQGWQYQNVYFRKRLQEHGIIQSMSRKGNCYDNCIMETFFGRIKIEMYYGFEKDYASFEEFAVAIDEYIDYYNNKRIQAKKMDASSKIQRSIHDVRLTYKYVSRILGTYQLVKKCWLLFNCYLIKYAVYYVILWLEYNNTIVAVK